MDCADIGTSWVPADTVTIGSRCRRLSSPVMGVRPVPDRFLVGFSFAGAQRDLVRQTADALEDRLGLGTVFYDDWFEHHINGKNGDRRLQEIYHDRCELVVMCVSGSYNDRPWTTMEYDAIRARHAMSATSTDRYRLFLMRVGDGDVDGLFGIDITSDARKKSTDEMCDLILGRLNLIDPNLTGDTLGLGEFTPGWPDQPPDVAWPLADHAAARLAFTQLVTAASPHRLLCISGPSATGKSTISHQMTTVGHILNVDCGRLDFKGTKWSPRPDRRVRPGTRSPTAGSGACGKAAM